MEFSTCLACLVTTVSGCGKNALRRVCSSSEHITNLCNLLFFRYLWLHLNHRKHRYEYTNRAQALKIFFFFFTWQVTHNYQLAQTKLLVVHRDTLKLLLFKIFSKMPTSRLIHTCNASPVISRWCSFNTRFTTLFAICQQQVFAVCLPVETPL